MESILVNFDLSYPKARSEKRKKGTQTLEELHRIQLQEENRTREFLAKFTPQVKQAEKIIQESGSTPCLCPKGYLVGIDERTPELFKRLQALGAVVTYKDKVVESAKELPIPQKMTVSNVLGRMLKLIGR